MTPTKMVTQAVCDERHETSGERAERNEKNIEKLFSITSRIDREIAIIKGQFLAYSAIGAVIGAAVVQLVIHFLTNGGK